MSDFDISRYHVVIGLLFILAWPGNHKLLMLINKGMLYQDIGVTWLCYIKQQGVTWLCLHKFTRINWRYP